MKRSLVLLPLLLGIYAAPAFAQASGTVEPWFTLSIAEKPLSPVNAPGTHSLLVKYTNISSVVQWDGCVEAPGAYRLIVKFDGMLLTPRKPPENADDSNPLGGYRIKTVPLIHCGKLTRGIDPGQTITFPLWITPEYDMSKPGVYDIVVTRGTDLDNPARSVTVQSNTISIVVPEAGDDRPQP